jgi:P27 family predicted phage terminase small subunit
MKGRKPKSKTSAPEGENITSAPPAWLNATAREIWQITIERVESSGGALPWRFTEIFCGFCQSAAAAREADEILSREGLTVCDGRSGTRRHPLVSVRSQALLQLRAYAESLGLTPASSARLPLPAPKIEENPFAALLNEK